MDINAPTELDLCTIFDYLDELRESGDTNMFGASVYLVDEFGMEKKQARSALSLWMQPFKPGFSVTERVQQALSATPVTQ